MLSLQSPAKINLFLKIIGKRPDGYHEIASLFQAIDLCDTMHFALAAQDTFSCSDAFLPIDGTNLVIKARELFRRKTGRKDHISIHLKKNIPLQAGLGGGSSNAATTLWALNQLCGTVATDKELSDWGAEIGSDVSFFLSNGTAYCTGRGEVLCSLAPLANENIWVIKPPEGLSTAQVYKELNLDVLIPGEQIFEKVSSDGSNLGHSRGNQIIQKLEYFNDLEAPAFKLIPKLGVLKKTLEGLGFSTVLMSGSGSSFFCMGNGDLSVLSGHQIFTSQFINRDPEKWYQYP